MLQFSQYSHYGTVDNLLIFCHLAFQEKIIGFEHLLKSLIAFIKHLAEVRMITNDIHSKGERPLSSNLVSNEYTTYLGTIYPTYIHWVLDLEIFQKRSHLNQV